MKFICIGRNYAAHAAELHQTAPEQPVFFLKPDSAITRCNRPFFLPDFSQEVHYETEIIVKINRLGTIDGSPPGSPVPGILQARTLEWVAISFSNA